MIHESDKEHRQGGVSRWILKGIRSSMSSSEFVGQRSAIGNL